MEPASQQDPLKEPYVRLSPHTAQHIRNVILKKNICAVFNLTSAGVFIYDLFVDDITRALKLNLLN